MFEVRKTPNGWGVYNLKTNSWKSYNTTTKKSQKEMVMLNSRMHKSKENGAGYKIML